VLVGWTDSGTRPTFDVVTGISSGTLLGVYAFLGPKYDARLKRLILTLQSSDLVKMQPMRSVPCDGALGSSAPAEKLIRSEVTDEFWADLRQAHAEGRRFFVGTMNLETKQLVIWDIGAIASSDRPDARDLVCKVLLAAVSWPPLVPPVAFHVNVNGHEYTEQHCDGGAAAMAFVRFGALPGWPAADAVAQPGWLAGSKLYVLTGRKLYSVPAPVSKRALGRTGAYVFAMFESITRADIARLYSLCAASGMQFHLLSLPQDYHEVPLSATALFPQGAPAMFEFGYQMGVGGPPWRLTPPGAEPGEETVPRDGTGIAVCR
jgi:hypothetical protein